MERSRPGGRVENRADGRGEAVAETDAEASDAESFATRLERHEREAEGRTESAANAGDPVAGDGVEDADPEALPAIAEDVEDNEEEAATATGATNDGRARETATADDDHDVAASDAESEESDPAGPGAQHRSVSSPETNAQPANDGLSIEFSLANLGQSRPITINQITQLLLQVDPTLAARGMVKSVKPRAAGTAQELGAQNGWEAIGTGDQIRFGGSAEWQAASTPEGVDGGEKISFSAVAHAGLDIDARIDGEIPIDAGVVQARPDATGSIAPRTPVGEGAGRGRREIGSTAASSIWTLSVVPAAAAHVGAGANQRSAAGAGDGVAGRVADVSQGPTAAAVVSGEKSGSASTGEQRREESQDAQSKANQSITGIHSQGDLALPGGVAAGRTATGETQRGSEVVRQELLAAQIDRALAASVERSMASPSNGASHETVLQMSPRVLGRIRIAVAVESNKASVRMRVENAEARQLLTDSLPSLVASLKQRGIEVESVQIRESEAETIAAEQPLRGAESPRETAGWNPKRLERSTANAARFDAEAAETADVIVALRLDALA